MSFWDNVKKFTQPYTDDDYDEYDDEEGMDEYTEEPELILQRAAHLKNFLSSEITPLTYVL